MTRHAELARSQAKELQNIHELKDFRLHYSPGCRHIPTLEGGSSSHELIACTVRVSDTGFQAESQ